MSIYYTKHLWAHQQNGECKPPFEIKDGVTMWVLVTSFPTSSPSPEFICVWRRVAKRY